MSTVLMKDCLPSEIGDPRASALEVASLSEPLGAHSFSYFGTWENERLTR
jgi:hypothetical protein